MVNFSPPQAARNPKIIKGIGLGANQGFLLSWFPDKGTRTLHFFPTKKAGTKYVPTCRYQRKNIPQRAAVAPNERPTIGWEIRLRVLFLGRGSGRLGREVLQRATLRRVTRNQGLTMFFSTHKHSSPLSPLTDTVNPNKIIHILSKNTLISR